MVSRRQPVHRELTDVHGQHRSLQEPRLREVAVMGMDHESRTESDAMSRLRENPSPTLSVVIPTNGVEMVDTTENDRDRPASFDVRGIGVMGGLRARLGPVQASLRKTLHIGDATRVLVQFDDDIASEITPLPEFSLIVVPKTFAVSTLSEVDFTPLTLS